MNYETNTFGMDIIMAIVEKGEPVLGSNIIKSSSIDQSFRQMMSVYEKEASSFLSTFYNHYIQCYYTNLDKICTLKQLGPQQDDDCIIVKKCEEDI